MNILLLGGYRFLGRAIVDAALARGHTVSAFNRGNLPLPADVEQITGDRNAFALPPDRTWDAVLDTSGYTPRQAQATAAALHDRVGRYAFVSSISVYPFPMAPRLDETAPVAPLPHDSDDRAPRDPEVYGAHKAAFEAILEAALPGRVLAVRAGMIVGPHDFTDRFNSWIERAARPQPFIVPGDPAQPLQLIDVRDLAEWMVTSAERGLTGTYNVTGPQTPWRADDVAQICIEALGSGATQRAIASDELKALGILPWEHIAFWFEPDQRELMNVNVDRFFATHPRLRPLADTVRDTYAWLRTSDHSRAVALPPELELAALQR